MSKSQQIKSDAREKTLRFLYQCDIEKLYHFSDAHFKKYCGDFDLNFSEIDLCRTYITGIYDHLPAINEKISEYSKNWTIDRLGIIDRSILRLSTYELKYTDTPKKVVINEAINLGKKYGTNETGGFINASLDKISKEDS